MATAFTCSFSVCEMSNSDTKRRGRPLGSKNKVKKVHDGPTIVSYMKGGGSHVPGELQQFLTDCCPNYEECKCFLL